MRRGVSVNGVAGGGQFVTANVSKNLERNQPVEFDVGIGNGGGARIGTMVNLTF